MLGINNAEYEGRRSEASPMAIALTGEVFLLASREAVWTMLNDPGILQNCIPGCEQLEKLSETEFRAIAVTKIGPVKA
ncbi:MAG: SRPBCC domain-containing protein, partial [Rhodoplanes sp.]